MDTQPTAVVPSWWERPRQGGRGLLAAVVGALMVLVAGCGGGGDEGAGGEGEDASSRAAVRISPKDGAQDVATSGALKVTVSKGKLTSVRVKDSKGHEVKGEISGGGRVWKPRGHLGAATEYSVDAVAEDSEGREAAEHADFTTLTPENTFAGVYTPENGQHVGVGMPVSLRFTRGITEQAAVEKAIEVSADPSVPIESRWFGNDRLDFRPETYWKPGTKVTFTLRLNGVEGRPGVYGTQNRTVSFTIGRSQISTVDVAAKKMTVVREGKTIKTIPVTAGAPGTETYNGKMVISEKHLVTRMNGDTVGFGGEYDIKDVPHAMRLSDSGTFIHGNYWSGQWTFGRRNASHGCVGLFDQRGAGAPGTPAAWFFRNSLLGDLVIVKNSHDETIEPGNGLNVWNMPWEEWQAQ